MLAVEAQEPTLSEIGPAAILEQLELLVQDPVFRSSKRSVQFLRYVVLQTLEGFADQIKERTIGVEVFGRDPSYDTNVDHIVRTAANELRKRLAIYYGEERHRSELRMSLVPGSYIPRFTLASEVRENISEPNAGDASTHHPLPGSTLTANTYSVTSPSLPFRELPKRHFRRLVWAAAAATPVLLLLLGYYLQHRATAQDLFWKPMFETSEPVLLATGDVPDGPPTESLDSVGQDTALPILHKTSSPVIPFADAETMARVFGTLQSRGKEVIIRREDASSFSELRQGPVVLIGAFNNEWSLRLTRSLRYSLAL